MNFFANTHLNQLWTNEKSREFIANEYPWFLETFDGYKYPIQRADSIRYFVLAHYGGTYIDLDDVCIAFISLIETLSDWILGMQSPVRSSSCLPCLGPSHCSHRYLQ